MDSFLFLDTETTGNNLLSDRLFQVSFFVDKQVHSQYFKPPLPISIKAQSITHVTNKMVEDKEPFVDSLMKKELQKILEDHILVAHNASFDICMLSKEGVEVKKFICTLRVAKFIDEEGITPEYNLQYLRYFHELEVQGNAHDAEGDVLVLMALFEKLFSQMLEKYKDPASVVNKMIEISLQPSLYKTFKFGKYKGKKVEEVLEIDKGYLEWLLNQKLQNDYYDDDWIFTLKHYLKVK